MTPGHMTVVILMAMMTTTELVVMVDTTMTIAAKTMIIPEIMTEETVSMIMVLQSG